MSEPRPHLRRTASGAGFMVTGAILIQWTGALVQRAFAAIGPAASSAWRFLLGAVVLLLLTRPRVSKWTRAQWSSAVVLGVTTAVMNQCFYQAIERMPLGGAVAIEYLGPFCLAAFSKRSTRHLVFVVLAGVGVVALTRPGSGLNAPGVAFAATAGLCWALYVFASQRVGTTTPGFSGLAVSMTVAAIVTSPFLAGSTSRVATTPSLLVRLLLIALLAIVLGFGAELQGLRRLRPSTAGVILAGDPAVAFLIGWALLSQTPHLDDAIGLACVVLAGVGVTLDAATDVAKVPQ